MKQALTLALTAAAVFGLLVLPNHPGTLQWSALSRWPLELPVILLLMIVAGRIWGMASAVALLLVATTLLKVADYATFTAYNRTFNPILDLFLIEAGFGLFRDSVGQFAAIAAAILLGLFLMLLFLGLRFGLGAWGKLVHPKWAQAAAVAGLLLTGGWAVADAGHHLKAWSFEKSPPGTAWTSRLAIRRGLTMTETARDLAAFRKAAQRDQYQNAGGFLDKLNGHDVVLIWIESYGRASFDNPLYEPTHAQTLAKAEAAIRPSGRAIRSGWLTSPTAGGESWLAHGALSSGLWTSDNGRYNAMLASGQKWLFHFARDAGYRTTAFMPAITVGWPESAVMGFDTIYPAADLPYEGERFNWVTMPDQFTLSAYPKLLPDDDQPDFMQIALISSHAPWTPVPEMVPWDQVGDGTIFNEMAAQGPTPRKLWKDRDNVRDAYRRAVDYSLQAVFSHVERMGPDAPLVIIAGDHQAAGFVAQSENRDVPVHIIGPAELVAHIDHWDWTDGLVPDADGPVRRMDRFRNAFLEAFTSPALIAQASPAVEQ